MDKKEKAKIENSNAQAPVRKRRNTAAKTGAGYREMAHDKGSRPAVRVNKNKRHRRKNTSSFTYFLRAYAGLWLVLTVILCAVLWKNLSKYQKDYDAAAAAGAPELAMQESMDLFTADNIGTLIEQQQPEILSRFETIEQYKDFYRSFLEQKKVDFKKNEELYNDARPVFNVYAYDASASDDTEGELFAIVSFKAAGEKDSSCKKAKKHCRKDRRRLQGNGT
jgi:hypothetical protein